MEVETKLVTLESQSASTVTFTMFTSDAGIYEITIGGLTGIFTVEEQPEPVTPTPTVPAPSPTTTPTATVTPTEPAPTAPPTSVPVLSYFTELDRMTQILMGGLAVAGILIIILLAIVIRMRKFYR